MENFKDKVTKLRILTYMCPDYPEGLFQIYKELFESALGLECELKVLTTHAHEDNPFVKDTADIVFMSLISYMKILQQDQVLCDPLPVAPVYDLSQGRDQPMTYSDVIISQSKKEQIKTFDDLRGHKWAVVNDRSWVLYELAKLGHNASFFGNIVHTVTEKEAIKSVLDHIADATSVDASVLKFYTDEFPDQKDNIQVLCSWGPYAPNPIVVSSKLSNAIKTILSSSLLMLKQQHPELASKFKGHNILSFGSIDVLKFKEMALSLKTIEKQNIHPVYY